MNKFFSKNFICATDKYSTREEFKNAPYFRRVFKIDEFNNAEIFICGLGLYQLYINGVNITKGFLAPYINNPDDILYYDKYEVAKYLKEGENCIAVLLGNGFLNSVGGTVWKFDEANFRSSPKFALSFIVDDCVLFNADSKFKTSPSPIIFDDLRIGEHYDANLEQENWNQIGFDDTLWSKVKKAKAPKGKTILCDVEPITLQQEIRPISITPIEGGFLYDFGVNTSGVCRLTINGDRGQKIVLQHGEVLLENKSLYLKNLVCDVDESTNWQRDVFYPKGNCVEIYQPTFTYHGFRYVFIQGVYPEQATEDLLTFLVYNSDLGDKSVLLCDNEVVNSLQKITLNSDLSNFYYFPTDCPQREKNGWMADVAISAEQMLYNFDCVKSLREWLRNVRYAQQTDGALPGIVPTSGWGFEWGNGPAWDIALVEVVLLLYKFSDNIEILNENKNAIKKYIEYLCAKIDKKGLVCFGLPDWCECGLKYEGETFTPLEITDTLVSIDICNKAYTILSILNKNASVIMKTTIKNLLTVKSDFEVIVGVEPYLNPASLALWDKPEWYVQTGLRQSNGIIDFYSKLFNPQGDVSKRRLMTFSLESANVTNCCVDMTEYIGLGDFFHPYRVKKDFSIKTSEIKETFEQNIFQQSRL